MSDMQKVSINPEDIKAGMPLGHADAEILRAAIIELNEYRKIFPLRHGLDLDSAAFKMKWTENPQADLALVLLGRIDTTDPCDDDRIEQVQQIIRGLVHER